MRQRVPSRAHLIINTPVAHAILRAVAALQTVLLIFCLGLGFACAQGTAALRLAHFSPDAPRVDLLVDGKLKLKDVPFSEISAYFTLAAGGHELKVFPHRSPKAAATSGGQSSSGGGQTQSAPGVRPIEPLISDVTLESGGYYTLLVSGFFDPPPATSQLGRLKIEVAAGTKVSVTGPQGYAVHLQQGTTLPNLRPGSYTVTATRAGYQGAQYVVKVQSGKTSTLPITLQQGQGAPVRAPPTTAATAQPPVWHKTQLQLYQDKLALPKAGEASLRVIHASPTTQAVDVLLTPLEGGRPAGKSEALFSKLSYPNSSKYAAVGAGSYRLQLRLSGTDYMLADLPEVPLRAGTVYTLYLVGDTEDSYVNVIPGVDAVTTGNLAKGP